MIFAALIMTSVSAYGDFSDMPDIGNLKTRLDTFTEETLVFTGLQHHQIESGFRPGVMPEIHSNLARPMASKSR